MSREWLAVSSFAGHNTASRSGSFLPRRSRTRERKIVDAIVTSSGQWGESIPSCSALVRPPTPNHDSRLSAFAFPVSPFVHAACYFFPPLSEHASHPDNTRRVPFSTAATTTVAKYRCRCYPASDSIRRRDLARWEREDAEKA